jgi:rhodanese-related sulfurtransferase
MLFGLFSKNKSNRISTKQLKEEYLNDRQNKFFLDVRTKAEYKANHIRGFENISVDKLEANLGKIPKDKEVVVICQSGARSSMACSLLMKMGYENVTNVAGGMNNWNY